MTYEERLASAIHRTGSRVCPGIDPSPDIVSLLAEPDPISSAAAIPSTDKIRHLEYFCTTMVDALSGIVPAIKLQVAWFEYYGASGFAVLRNTLLRARRANLMTVVDAKRGDVPHTMEAYLDAWLGEETPAGHGGDALTVNGWLGSDVLDSCARATDATNTQCYVLTHTSNLGAAELLRAPLADGNEWWSLTASGVNERGLGAVVGATHAGLLRHALELMPRSPLLIPGVGAQGGDAGEVMRQLTTASERPHLVVAARSLLPQAQCSSESLAQHVREATNVLSMSLHNSQHG